MKRKSLKTFIFLRLRRIGMLCRKPRPYKPVVRVSKTVLPDQQLTNIDREIHVYLETKKVAAKGCKFDTEQRTCECGYTMNLFGEKGCKNK